MPARPRVIVATPAADERERLAEWLIAEHYEPALVADALAASSEISRRPSLALIVDYTLTLRADVHGTWRARRPQTPPVVLGNADPPARARTEGLSGIFLERPFERVTLLCMLLMAILEGRPERRSPRKVSSVLAKLNGIPTSIVDLSHEGMRIALPRQQVLPPPVFRLAVPMAGVTLNVRRMWTAAPDDPAGGPVMWCGGAITENPEHAARAWRGLVEAAPARSAR